MTDDLELSRELTTIVRATAGVHDVYTTGGLLSVAARAATGAGGEQTRVRVGHDTVSVSISVASGFTAPETLRAVTAAIADHLAVVGGPARRISVTASRVE